MNFEVGLTWELVVILGFIIIGVTTVVGCYCSKYFKETFGTCHDEHEDNFVS